MLPLTVFLSVLTLYEHSQIDLAPQYNDKHLINIEGLNLLTVKKCEKEISQTLYLNKEFCLKSIFSLGTVRLSSVLHSLQGVSINCSISGCRWCKLKSPHAGETAAVGGFIDGGRPIVTGFLIKTLCSSTLLQPARFSVRSNRQQKARFLMALSVKP